MSAVYELRRCVHRFGDGKRCYRIAMHGHQTCIKHTPNTDRRESTMHEYIIEDEDGNAVESVAFCSDSCHRAYTLEDYAGWNGCHEAEFTTYCANCGVVIPGLEDACEHQRDNIVVNRFPSEDGEKCEHGNWIQLPSSYLVAA